MNLMGLQSEIKLIKGETSLKDTTEHPGQMVTN